MARQRLSC